MLISDAVEEYLCSKQHSITHDTRAWYMYHLDHLVKWCSRRQIEHLSEITPALIQKALSEHPRTNSNTRHGFVQVVKGFLRWCSEDDELGVRERTVRRIELPKNTQPEVSIYTYEEITRLLKG
jgi:site-specific recombinase XerD